jgi:hypothetical protein
MISSRQPIFCEASSAELERATDSIRVLVCNAKEKRIENCLRQIFTPEMIDNAKQGKDWEYFNKRCNEEGIELVEHKGYTVFKFNGADVSHFVVRWRPEFYIHAAGIGAI